MGRNWNRDEKSIASVVSVVGMRRLWSKATRWHAVGHASGYIAHPTGISNHCIVQVTRILAVRHGETAWNRDTRIQGHTDIELNEHGRWQAERLAHTLREEPIAACYASDLSRAFDTAQAVARLQGGQVHQIGRASCRERV